MAAGWEAVLNRANCARREGERQGPVLVDAWAVIHTAFNHDFSRRNDAVEARFAAVQPFGELIEGSGRQLVLASGLVAGASVEIDRPDPRPPCRRSAVAPGA
jgi:hypothetical protein